MTDIDISPEAVEHLCAIHEGYEQHGTAATLRALSAALTQSRAETAAAYEAAGVLDTHGDSAVTEALGARLCCNGHMCGCRGADVGSYLQHLIRALATPDQSSALAAIEAAKAAAQADYDARIMAAIDTTPDPRDAVIARLVEALLWYADDSSSQGNKARAALAATKKVE